MHHIIFEINNGLNLAQINSLLPEAERWVEVSGPRYLDGDWIAGDPPEEAELNTDPNYSGATNSLISHTLSRLGLAF